MAGIKNGSRTIQDCLTCYLCGNIFRKPRILPCGHTFCSECLFKLKDDILKDGICTKNESSSEVRVSNSGNPSSRDSAKSGSQFSAADSFDIAVVSADTDPNCYRPHLPARPQSHPPTSESNGLPRSSTFSQDSQQNFSDQSLSRYSAPPNIGAVPNHNVCSKCGNVSPATLPRRRKSSQSPSPTLKPRDSHASPRWNTSPKRGAESVCSFDQKHGKEMEQFVCPLPDCKYTLRVMNLIRWSPKNTVVSDITTVWKMLQSETKDACTQTDISNHESLLVTIPRSLVDRRPLHPLGQRRRHSSLMDMAMESAASVEGLSRGYLPSGDSTWRSYAAMLGMNILHQIVHW